MHGEKWFGSKAAYKIATPMSALLQAGQRPPLQQPLLGCESEVFSAEVLHMLLQIGQELEAESVVVQDISGDGRHVR